METQHLTKALIELSKAVQAEYFQVIKGHPAPALFSTMTRNSLGIGLGVCVAHQTSLEAPLASEGLPVRVLEAIAEDLLEQRRALQNLPLLEKTTVGEQGKSSSQSQGPEESNPNV